jgi:hypothetical protein
MAHLMTDTCVTVTNQKEKKKKNIVKLSIGVFTKCDTVTLLRHRKSLYSVGTQLTAEDTVGAPTCF